MTPREQLFAALNGELLERPPVWLLYPCHATEPIGWLYHHAFLDAATGVEILG